MRCYECVHWTPGNWSGVVVDGKFTVKRINTESPWGTCYAAPPKMVATTDEIVCFPCTNAEDRCPLFTGVGPLPRCQE